MLRNTEKGSPKIYYNYNYKQSCKSKLKDGYERIKLIETTITPENVDALFTENSWNKTYYSSEAPDTNLSVAKGVLTVTGSRLMGVNKKINLNKGWHFFKISTKNNQQLRFILRKNGIDLRNNVIDVKSEFGITSFFF